MRHDLAEGSYMRGHGIVAFGAMMRRVADEVTVHGHHIQMAIDVVRYLETVAECRRLVAALRHTDGHIVGAETQRRPKTIIIAVVGVLGIIGLKRDFLSVDACSDFGELDDFGMLNICRNHNHHGM